MIQTDKLVQFYCAQYKTFAKKKHKKAIPETGPYPKRMQRLSKELLAIHSPKIKQLQLENYHRQLRNLAYFVYRDANPIYIMQFETACTGCYSGCVGSCLNVCSGSGKGSTGSSW